MEKKIGLWMNIIINIVMAATLSIFGPLFANGAVDWKLYPSTWALSWCVAFTCSMLIPTQKWGAKLAAALKCKPEGLAAEAVKTAVTVLIMVPIVTVATNIYVVHFVMGAPLSAGITAGLPTLPQLIGVGFIASMIVAKPCLMLAMRIAGAKVK